jgi:hypothetical protein
MPRFPAQLDEATNAAFLKIGLWPATAVMGAMLSLAQYPSSNYGMSLILTVISLISMAVSLYESFQWHKRNGNAERKS